MVYKQNPILPDNLKFKLNFLKLTRNGQINLSVFDKKVLYKALSLLQRTHIETPQDPYNVYYALCMSEAKRIEMEPNWDAVTQYPTYNHEADMTLDGEKFDMKKCYYFLRNATKVIPKTGTFSSQFTKRNSNHGPTFTRGVTYWKYSIEYKYPDQAIDEETNPCPEDPTYKPRLPQGDPSRFGIDQVEQLKKAIRSGDINKNGLSFLRDTYVRIQELINIIDAYMQAGADKEKHIISGEKDEPKCDIHNLPF